MGDGAAVSSRRGVLESSAAIDAAVDICRWGHETEGLSVFGIRLGHQASHGRNCHLDTRYHILYGYQPLRRKIRL
jgi:hypothetical protein